MKEYDIIIIGAGPAGLTAGLYAERQGSKTLILEKDTIGGLGKQIARMENYPGFEEISGIELIEKMKNQLKKTEIKEFENVESIIKKENKFEVNTINKQYLTKSIILATGSAHKNLNVKGEEEFKGRGVSYCATCDGLFFQNKKIIVAGGGNTAIQEALFLKNLGCNVTIIHKRNKLQADKALQEKINNINVILKSEIIEIKGETVVTSIIIKNKNEIKEIPTDWIFISTDYKTNNELSKELNLKLNETNHIITDKNQKTNIPYVYAAGDICDELKQWVVACAHGAIAATSAYHDLNL